MILGQEETIRLAARNGAAQRLAILGFHKIGSPPPGTWDTWFYISEKIFTRQMSWLQKSHWQIIDVHTFVEGLSSPETLPSHAVLLTFDDGYRSMLNVTLPLLRAFNFPAILFVPTNFIGLSNDFDKDVEPREPICDWDELRELQNQGVSIQSHSVSHRRFSTLDVTELDEELKHSKAALEDGLERPVDVFSFPYGDAGQNSETTTTLLKRIGYKAACLYGNEMSNSVPIATPFQSQRYAIGPDTDLGEIMEHDMQSAGR